MRTDGRIRSSPTCASSTSNCGKLGFVRQQWMPAVVAALWLHPALSSGQSARYHAPRTPWGDPDLQGTYTNRYEQSTPLERPDEFAGRRREDVTSAELSAVLAKRN